MSPECLCASSFLLACAMGCGAGAAAGPPGPLRVTSQVPGSAPLPEVAPRLAADEWRCGGDLVPPSGWEQETSFEDGKTPNSREVAARHASQALAQRLCAGSADCASLTARVALWKTGSSGDQVCAMAVVKKEDLADWRGRSLSVANLDTALAVAAEQLLQPLGGAKGRVAVVEVVDLGVAGGPRADWLRGRLSRMLEKGASVVDPPRGWAGNGVPAGVDLVVRGSLVARSEGGIAVLEVTWDGLTRYGSHVHAAPVAFPESASPHADVPAMETHPALEGLAIRIDSTRGGGLCAGERTQLWLESDHDAVVRVFDLYGAGDALVEFPYADGQSAHVQAKETVALGGKLGFEAVPVPGFEYERFLVLAAPNEAALGRFRAARGPCRLPADVARELHRGAGVPPGARAAWAGYRITNDPSCAAPPSREAREGVVPALATLPVCTLE